MLTGYELGFQNQVFQIVSATIKDDVVCVQTSPEYEIVERIIAESICDDFLHNPGITAIQSKLDTMKIDQ